MKLNTGFKVGVLSASNYITVLVNTILFPIFPTMAKALNLNIGDLALLIWVVSFPSAILNLLGGILSDRFGKKPVMVVSLIIYGFGGLFAGVASLLVDNPFYFILLGRFFQGIGSATPMFLSVALVGDIFNTKERNKAMGFLETANGLGKVSSPILGALIGMISWYSIFFLYPIVAIPISILTWIYIKEPKKRNKINWVRQKKAFLLFVNRSRFLTLLPAFLVIFTLIGTMFWLSDYLETILKVHQLIRGFIISLPASFMMLTTLFAGKLSTNFNSRHILSIGIIIMAMGTFLIIFTKANIFLWPVIALIGIGSGISLPVVDTFSTCVKDKNLRGVVATIYGSARSLGGAFAPVIFSYLLKYSINITFLFVAIFCLIIGIISLYFINEKEILPKKLQS